MNEGLHNEELRDAPILRQIGGKHPFEVPEDYFGAFFERFEVLLAQENSQESDPELIVESKPAPFAAPEGYFESFNERLNARIEREKELDEAPTLQAMEKKEVFQTPDGYFDASAKSLEKITDAPSRKKQRIVPFYRRPTMMIGIAATVLALIAGTWVLNQGDSNDYEISDEEWVAAIEAEGIEAYELAEALDESELASIYEMDLSTDEIDDLSDEINASDLELEFMDEI